VFLTGDNQDRNNFWGKGVKTRFEHIGGPKKTAAPMFKEKILGGYALKKKRKSLGLSLSWTSRQNGQKLKVRTKNENSGRS